MALVRRNWFGLFVLALVVTIGALPMLWRSASSAVAQVAATGSAAERDQKIKTIQARLSPLRQRLCLTSSDLAAMACTPAQVEALVGGLIAWAETNGALLDEACKTQRRAEGALQEACSAINLGLTGQGIAQLESALVEAIREVSQLEESAAASVTARLSSAQQEVWRAARANAGMPRRYRYVPGLEPAQRLILNAPAQPAERRELVIRALSSIQLNAQLLGGNNVSLYATALHELENQFIAQFISN